MNNNEYGRWCERADGDPEIKAELAAMAGDCACLDECFGSELEFGTGGLRGIIGAGTNRMNIYTVGRATQGLADYINSRKRGGSAAIAYDSRKNSELFARTAAQILAANGIRVFIYRELEPTPMLSYAVRRLGCDAGIVITASHNPAKYNGYKVYGADGCQITPDAADAVMKKISAADIFDGVKKLDFDRGLSDGIIEYIKDDVIEAYLECVNAQRAEPELDLSGLRVIYTPLHGSGNKPVRAILSRVGITDVTVVPEQELPDGSFPTAPYPNPEIKQAFEYALRLAESVRPDLLLATDPDCDRVGIAVPDGEEYRLLTGNEVGVLLLDFICARRTANDTMPANPVAVKTIVTTEMARCVADSYGVELIDVLTGFKFIGEQIGLLERSGEENRYIFGFEESYGYLAGAYVRDKDAVVASMLICEMTAYYKSTGRTLIEVLNALYDRLGWYLCSQKSFTFEGHAGMERISGIMDSLRERSPAKIAEADVVRVTDYKSSVSREPLTGKTSAVAQPKSNVISFMLSDGSSLTVRPSGTEPKIKFYLSSVGDSREASARTLARLEEYAQATAQA